MATEKRLIDANVLIAMCKDIAATEWNKHAAPISWSDAYEGFINDIEEQPTVDAVEVVHGRWIIPTIINGRSFKIPHCSVCGEVPCGVSENTKYCAICGARMDLGDMKDE